MSEKLTRPSILGGITVRVATGCGNMYIQMNWSKGRLFEIFAALGKTGGCAASQTEALTRSTTLGLRSGVEVQDYVKQYRGVSCPQPLSFPKESAVRSCADAIGKVLQDYGNLGVEDVVKLILKANYVSDIDEVEEERLAKVQMELLALKREEQNV